MNCKSLQQAPAASPVSLNNGLSGSGMKHQRVWGEVVSWVGLECWDTCHSVQHTRSEAAAQGQGCGLIAAIKEASCCHTPVPEDLLVKQLGEAGTVWGRLVFRGGLGCWTFYSFQHTLSLRAASKDMVGAWWCASTGHLLPHPCH